MNCAPVTCARVTCALVNSVMKWLSAREDMNDKLAGRSLCGKALQEEFEQRLHRVAILLLTVFCTSWLCEVLDAN